MPTLRITIKMDNAAFDETPGDEVARILREAADAVQGLGDFLWFGMNLRDLNGNTVGEAKVTR
jgi:hypothetical protein